MDTLISAILSFFIEILIIIFDLVIAMFSPRHRAKVREKWATSALYQVEIVFSLGLRNKLKCLRCAEKLFRNKAGH